MNKRLSKPIVGKANQLEVVDDFFVMFVCSASSASSIFLFYDFHLRNTKIMKIIYRKLMMRIDGSYTKWEEIRH